MSAPTIMDTPPAEAEATGSTRTRQAGFALLVLSGICLLLLVGAAGTQATFLMNIRGAATVVTVPNLVVPVLPTVLVATALVATSGILCLTRTLSRRALLAIVSVAMIAFLFAFLAWAARDQSLNLLSILRLTVRAAVPLTFGALSGVLCERAGVMNIAIEGQFLTAAFAGALVGSLVGSSFAGLAAGAIGGALIGLILAIMSVTYRTDQIIVGVVLIVFAAGLTAFLSSQILRPNPSLNTPPVFDPIAIPLLSQVPLIGPLLFRHTIFVYGAVATVAVIHWGLFHTRWGLRLRSVGEHPRAADTVGINVFRTRYVAVVLGGVVAGLGGAFFTLDSAGQFSEGMTAGQGFIALAAMIVGRWRPSGALMAALLFGFAVSMAQGLSLVSLPIPSQFLLMTPYIVTIVVVAGVIGRPRPPAADGVPYVKE